MSNSLSQQPIALPCMEPVILNQLIEALASEALPEQQRKNWTMPRLFDLCIQAADYIKASAVGTTSAIQQMQQEKCEIISQWIAQAKVFQETELDIDASYSMLENGLELVNKAFYKTLYHRLDPKNNLPASIRNLEAQSLSLRYNMLKKKYAQDLLVRSMLKAVYTIAYSPSYGNDTRERLHYATTLLNNLYLWSRQQGTQEQLVEIAIAMNLNSTVVLGCIARQAEARLTSCTRQHEKVKALNLLRKQYLQATTSTRWAIPACTAYQLNALSIRERIDQWMDAQYELAKSEEAQEVKEKEELQRVETKEDGLFFSLVMRIMVLAGFFKTNKFSPVIRAFSQVVRMSRTETPNYGNLIRLASAKVPMSIIEKLIRFFEDCLAIAHKIRMNKGKFPEEIDAE